MDVYLYKTKGKNGYLYDMSLNPHVDFEILKRTRKIEKLEVITEKIPIEQADEILRKIYNKKNIVDRFIKSQDFSISRSLKKFGIKKTDHIIKMSSVMPSREDISVLEEYISGRVTTLDRLLEIKRNLGIKSNIEDIVQALYCQRRIKMVPSIRNLRNKQICSFCSRESCAACSLGFNNGDVMLYAADNYNIRNPVLVTYNKRKMSESLEKSFNDVLSFVKSKKLNAILWCVPKSFEYSILTGAMAEIINKGGRVLYVTSTSGAHEAIEALKGEIENVRIRSVNRQDSNLDEADISICSYSEYPIFYKAFDLVILDKLRAFIEKSPDNIENICQRAAKERGKFLIITYDLNIRKSKALKASPEIIALPVSKSYKLIPEPRIITSRYLKSDDPFIPPIAIDIIKWSINQKMGVLIFTPDEVSMQKVYYYLTTYENMDDDDIDISYEFDKSGFMRFKRREVNILISVDFRDSQHTIEDINVVIMHGDDERYDVDTLINMTSMAAFHMKDRVGEAVITAVSENNVISSAKSIIRSANKIAWERKYSKI